MTKAEQLAAGLAGMNDLEILRMKFSLMRGLVVPIEKAITQLGREHAREVLLYVKQYIERRLNELE